MSLVLGHDNRSNLITVLLGCRILWQWVYRCLINSWFSQLKEICLSKKVKENMSNHNLFHQNMLTSTSALQKRGLGPNCNFTCNFTWCDVKKNKISGHAFKVWAFFFFSFTLTSAARISGHKAMWFPLDADPCAGFQTETGARRMWHSSTMQRAAHVALGICGWDWFTRVRCFI